MSTGASPETGVGRGTSCPVFVGELQTPLLEPVAQPSGADDVVAVVGRDLVEDGGGRPVALAELEPLLERDDARAGVPQLDLAPEAVERLEPLDE